MLDGWIVRRVVDPLGDWLQETRGVPLPDILRVSGSVLVGSYFFTIAAQTSMIALGHDDAWSGPWALAFVLVWWTTISSIVRKAPQRRRDAENWEDPNVRMGYVVPALVHRDVWILVAVRLFFILTTPLMVWIFATQFDLDTLAMSMMFLSIVVNDYAECILPKPPRRVSHATKLAYSEMGP